MNPTPTHGRPNGRREFVRDAARLAALGGVGALAAVLARRGASGGSATCRGSGVCEGCRFVVGCAVARPDSKPADKIQRVEGTLN